MERLVLVHGSVAGGRPTWTAQLPLEERFELVILERPGFPPNPLVERVDFEADAELVAGLLEPGDHVVGHSYGGVISLLAAASRPERVRSLTVIEPPATRVAHDDPTSRLSLRPVSSSIRAAGATTPKPSSDDSSKRSARRSIHPPRSHPHSSRERER